MFKTAVAAFLVMAALSAFDPCALAQEGGFSVSRFVLSASIEDKEPGPESTTFKASTSRVYCFLEAADIAEDTNVSFVWSYEGEEVARIDLQIRKGQRWRTYSSKKIGGRSGRWRVDVVDPAGNAVTGLDFTVQ